MDNLILKAGSDDQTPKVEFRTNGELAIKGKSYPEDPMKFFGPLINWIKELKSLNLPKIVMTVRLDYFNTSTSKLMLHIFKILENMQAPNQTEVKIIWLYHGHDEDMIESGKDYKSLVNVPFELVEVEKGME